MQSLTRDCEKLSSKATANHDKLTQDLDRLISDLDSLKALIQKGSQIQGFQVTQNNSLQPILSRSRAASQAALLAHKELHSLSSKWIKMIDKKFNQTVLPFLGPNLVPSTQQAQSSKPKQPFQSNDAQYALKQVIMNHLLRQGRFETAQTFAEESQVALSCAVLESCQELYRITDSIQVGDLSLTFEWVQNNQDWLNARESPLEFDLHRSQFVRILTQPAFDYPPPSIANQSSPSEHDVKSKMKIEIEEESMMQEDNPTIDDPASQQTFQQNLSSIDHPIELPKIIEPDSNQMELDPDSRQVESGQNRQLQEAYSKSRQQALEYARLNFPKFFPKRWDEAVKLTASSLYTPFRRLKQSPYSEFYRSSIANSNNESGEKDETGSPWLHANHLIPLFIKEFCARLGWSKDLPLVVATDLGSGGALAKIAKVRSVMKEKRTEWSQANELPVEIPLPLEYRFHSVFACPVSKEQSTELNPPMMMPCGHVIAKESMQKLAKGGGTVKCPYCPSSSSMSSAMQVYF